MTLALPRTTAPAPSRLLAPLWQHAPGFTATGLLAALALLPLYAAMALDTRLFQGESVWIKPIKFHIALAVYLLTLAFFARWLPATLLARRGWRVFVWAVNFAVIAELVWVGAAAAINTASHFNTTIPAFTVIYSLMGVFAVLLTSASLVMGVAIWRNRATGLEPALHLSIALGLVLTFALTVPVAGTLSSLGAHLVGPSDGSRLWLLGWSRDAGDPRVAHFLATHALHALPLAGLLASRLLPPTAARGAVILAAVAFSLLVAGTFWQAMQGRPFLPWLG
jgi:hypothetical protein